MKRAARVALVVTFAVATAHAAKINTDHDPGTAFDQYETYGWKIKIPEPDQDPTGERRNLDRLIRETADAEMADRGYRRVDADPDMWLVYAAVAGPQVSARVYRGEVWTVGTIDSYAEGNLVLEVLDGKSEKVVWRGVAEGGVKPDKRETRLPKIVRQVLKKFPPPPEK